MQIDWLTVAAQIVNFLVLVWLLQRLLYTPITNAMRRREDRIEGRLAEAREARRDADERADRLKRKEEELEAEKDAILARAREEADALRKRLEDEIREEMEEKREAWRAHLAEERDAFVASLQTQAGRQVLEVTRQVLADFADSDLGDRVARQFVARLKDLAPDTREKMSQAAAQEGAEAVVETGAAIDGTAKGRITRAVHGILSSDIGIDYRENPELVLGIRLTVGDHTAEWSAVRYLDRLGAELGEIVDAGRRSMARPSGGGERDTA